MRVAITGGMGFIGTEVTKWALDLGWEVTVVDFMRQLIPRYEAARLPILDDVYSNLSRCANVLEPWEFIENWNHGAGAVIHLGAEVDTKDMGTDLKLFDRNVMYVQRLAARAKSTGASIVFASSASVYGSGPRRHPITPYAMTKALGENILRDRDIPVTCLRFFNVYGSHEHHKGEMASVPFKLARAYRTGDKFDMHSPDASRDFVSVSTVASVVVKQTMELMHPDPPSPWVKQKTFDVGSGVATSFRDLDNFIMQAMGHKTSVVREIQMPDDLRGRYQGYTCAGTHTVPNVGQSNVRSELEHMYGK